MIRNSNDDNMGPESSFTEFGTKSLTFLSDKCPNASCVYSPISISLALAMLYAGARGVTRLELERVLFGTNSPEANARIHVFYAAEIARFSERDELFALELTNKLYAHMDFALAKEFMDIIEKNYLGLLDYVDFNDAEATAKKINNFVAEKTRNKILNILPTYGVLGMELMPMNVAYFKGRWRQPFQKKFSTKKPFFVSECMERQVWMMKDSRNADYYEDDLVQMLVLPYCSTDRPLPSAYCIVSKEKQAQINDASKSLYVTQEEVDASKKRMEMWFFLPKQRHALTDILATLSERGGESLKVLRKACTDQKVEIDLPRFKIDFRFEVNKLLTALGANSFSAGKELDFRGMSTVGKNPNLGEIFHRAVIEVDEEGAEAAAATGAMFPVSADPDFREPAKFVANQPFAFAIAARNTVLFAGISRMED